MNKKVAKFLSALALVVSSQTFAAVYNVPPSNESLIGKMQYNVAVQGDNVITVTQRYDIGHNAFESANPYLDLGRGFNSGTPFQIPTQHLLPDQPREGIIINLPEMRMYYFPEGSHQVYTYPIGIGKVGKTIPITRTSVARKTVNPTWTPPDDIRAFDLQQGIVLPKVMPAGPDNPLGPYAIYTRIPTYLIHSTIFPESIGTRASFGCIRMYESDIKDFFPSIKKGIPIVIINSPVKIGWQDDRLYMEAHPPLEEHNNHYDASLPGMVHMILEASKNQPMLIDWQMVSYMAEERDGMPHEVGIKLP